MGTGALARSALPAGASWTPRGVCPSVAGGLAGKTLVIIVVRSLARSLWAGHVLTRKPGSRSGESRLRLRVIGRGVSKCKAEKAKDGDVGAFEW